MTTQTEAMKRWVEVFDGNWHDEPVDSEWADRAHQALAEMRQAIAEAEQPALMARLQKRDWVGLTDEERRDLRKCNQQHDEFAKAIEAKLKEKNYG